MDNITYIGNSNVSSACTQHESSKVVYLILIGILQLFLMWYLYAKYFIKEQKQLITALNESYVSFESRFQSFQNCNVIVSQYICNLCEAGFFYTGDGGPDGVACFSCNIRLRDWEDYDNPWVQHARWSKECSYLLLCKGQLFIDRIQGVYDISLFLNEHHLLNEHTSTVAEEDQLDIDEDVGNLNIDEIDGAIFQAYIDSAEQNENSHHHLD